MSIKAVSWVMDNSEATGTTRMVLTVIAWHANDAGASAWPSHETIARRANTSVDSVKRAIRQLVTMGELAVEVGAGGSAKCRPDRRPNRYTIQMNDGGAPTHPRDDSDGGE